MESQDEYPTNDCIICYEPLNIITDIEITPCMHMFHTVCYDEWIKRTYTCPLCRSELSSEYVNHDDFHIWTNYYNIDSWRWERERDERWREYGIRRTIIPEPQSQSFDFRLFSGGDRIYARDVIASATEIHSTPTEIEYFSVIYRPYTNFAMEIIEQLEDRIEQLEDNRRKTFKYKPNQRQSHYHNIRQARNQFKQFKRR